MEANLINQQLKEIVPEELLQIILSLQELRDRVSSYMDKCKDKKDELAEDKWTRAQDAAIHINSSICDMIDLVSIELTGQMMKDEW